MRVSRFANACNYQMVCGHGFGKDRYLTSTQAKNAGEGMACASGVRGRRAGRRGTPAAPAA